MRRDPRDGRCAAELEPRGRSSQIPPPLRADRGPRTTSKGPGRVVRGPRSGGSGGRSRRSGAAAVVGGAARRRGERLRALLPNPAPARGARTKAPTTNKDPDLVGQGLRPCGGSGGRSRRRGAAPVERPLRGEGRTPRALLPDPAPAERQNEGPDNERGPGRIVRALVLSGSGGTFNAQGLGIMPVRVPAGQAVLRTICEYFEQGRSVDAEHAAGWLPRVGSNHVGGDVLRVEERRRRRRPPPEQPPRPLD